jgi:hypothetical protein
MGYEDLEGGKLMAHADAPHKKIRIEPKRI